MTKLKAALIGASFVTACVGTGATIMFEFAVAFGTTGDFPWQTIVAMIEGGALFGGFLGLLFGIAREKE